MSKDGQGKGCGVCCVALSRSQALSRGAKCVRVGSRGGLGVLPSPAAPSGCVRAISLRSALSEEVSVCGVSSAGSREGGLARDMSNGRGGVRRVVCARKVAGSHEGGLRVLWSETCSCVWALTRRAWDKRGVSSDSGLSRGAPG